MFLKLLNYLLIGLQGILIFNLIIIVHELGHFLAGRWRGLVIEEFGVWFGKPLWRKKFGGVWYSLGSIPAGGFVKLPQLAPMESVEGQSDTPREELPHIKPIDKAIVAFAGPLFSFLFALALATIVWVVGKPTSQSETTTTIGLVLKDGPADKAGLKPGDKIVAIDGRPVARFFGASDSVIWNIVSSEGEKIDFLIERDGKQQHIFSGWSQEEKPGWKRKAMRKVKIGPLTVPAAAYIEPGSVADKAGLKRYDYVTKVNGKPIVSADQISEILHDAPAAPLTLTVDRTGADQKKTSLDIAITPPPVKAGEEEFGPDLGVGFGYIYKEHPTPWQQVKDSVKAIRNTISSITSMHSSIKADQLSGPIGIMNAYLRILDSDDGWLRAVAFSVFFNVNLAIMNMLPFPLLDGGHIALAIAEIIRKKPVLEIKALEIVQNTGFALLAAFMLFVTFFDVTDHFGNSSKAGATPAPKVEPAKKA